MPETTFGVVIDPSRAEAGATRFKTAAKSMGKAARDAHGEISSTAKQSGEAILNHAGAFERASASMAKYATQGMMIARSFGTFFEGSVRFAEATERSTIRLQKMTEQAMHARNGQDELVKAHQAGTIASATYSAALDRHRAVLAAVAAAERSLGEAQKMSTAVQREQKDVQTAIALQRTNLSAGNLLQKRDQELLNRAIHDTSITMKQYEDAEIRVMQRTKLLHEAEQNLANLRSRAAGNLPAIQAAEQGLFNAKQAQKVATDELAASEKLLTGAQAGVGAGIIPMIAVITAVIAVLAAMAIAIYAVHKAWEFFKEGIAEASKIEQARVGLRELIGDAEKTETILNGLRELSVKSGGRFTVSGLSDAAVKMQALGVATGNLLPRLEAFANLASRTTSGTIESIVQIYDRAVDSISNGVGLSTRELRSFTNEGVNLAEMLGKAMGVSADKAKELILANKISVQQLNAAFESTLDSEGALSRRANIFTGLVNTLKTGWKEVKARFAEPIMIALEPLLRAIVKILPDLEHVAEMAGKAIGSLLDSLNQVAANRSWGDAILHVWMAVMIKMANFALETIVTMFTTIGPAAAQAFWAGFVAYLKEKTSSLGSAFNPFAGLVEGGSEAIDELIKRLKLKMPAFNEAGQAIRAGITGAALAVDTTDRFATGKKPGKESDWDKYKTDVQIINDHWEEYNTIQSKVQDETERTRRVIELESKTAKELVNPQAYLDSFTTIQGRWEAMENARLQKAKEIDQAIKMGTASVTDSITRGINKALEQWGTWQKKVSDFAEEVTNTVGNGFATAFGDIITGTKNAGDAFRDMAVSMLNDIARLIVKMLVLQAVQAALGYFGFSGTTSVGTGKYGALGGAISGPSHSQGGVKMEAEGGEYMFRKDRARSIGMENLEALHRGDAMIVRKYGDGGQVWGGSHYGANPRTLNPPYHFDPSGNSADYDFFSSRMNTRFTPDSGNTSFDPLGDVDLPPIGPDPTIMTPPVIRPPTVIPPPRPGPSYGLPTGPGGLENAPSLFGGPSGGPQVTVSWIGSGSAPYWNQPPTQVGPGQISIGADAGGTYNSTFGTWDSFDAGGNLVRTPVTPPSGFGPGLAAAGLSVVGFDANTGTTFYRDSSGNTYAAGPSSPRETQPGGAAGNQSGRAPVGGGVTPYSNFGGVTSGIRSTIGNAAFDSHAAGLMEMAFQSFGGNPNIVSNDRETNPTFESGVWRMGEGGLSQVGERGQMDKRWVFPSQAESWKLGLSFASNADKSNAWLISHNPWYYGPGGVLEQQKGADIPHFHSGGMANERDIRVKSDEGIFTKGQMANLAPVTNANRTTNINVVVNNNGDGSGRVSAKADSSDREAVELAKAMESVAQKVIDKNLRFNGSLAGVRRRQ